MPPEINTELVRLYISPRPVNNALQHHHEHDQAERMQAHKARDVFLLPS